MTVSSMPNECCWERKTATKTDPARANATRDVGEHQYLLTPRKMEFLMAAILSDQDIASLIQEKKPLPPDYQRRLKLRRKRGHREASLDITGVQAHEFRLILRQNAFNPLDFSVILAYLPAGTNRLFRLCRYNGKSHEHTNSIENQKFYEFHTHRATERYQEIGANEDAYAEPAEGFGTLRGALSCMFAECGFEVPPNVQEEFPLEV